MGGNSFSPREENKEDDKQVGILCFVERERERESPRNLEANEFFFGFVLNGFLIRMGAHVKQRKRESISYSIQAWFRSEQITKMPLVSYNNHVRQHELLVVVVLL